MNNSTGKRLLALVRGGDYAHPGEEEANELLFAGVLPDTRRRVLDMGCGGGGTASWVRRRGLGTVTGIEIDAPTAALARKRHPEVTIVEGDLGQAGRVLAGPYDLTYSMTAVYAVPDQATVFRELAALAAPGAELRMLEYADPTGLFSTATAGNPSWGWWRPLIPRDLPDLLSSAGWSGIEVQDLTPEFIRWYRRLCERIAARHQEIAIEFGTDWYEFVVREYTGVLDMVSAGVLGGILVRATARVA